jgi:hypothetical protein
MIYINKYINTYILISVMFIILSCSNNLNSNVNTSFDYTYPNSADTVCNELYADYTLYTPYTHHVATHYYNQLIKLKGIYYDETNNKHLYILIYPNYQIIKTNDTIYNTTLIDYYQDSFILIDNCRIDMSCIKIQYTNDSIHINVINTKTMKVMSTNSGTKVD